MELIHICEVCGKTEILDEETAYNQGWDYPRRMGTFGIVSPRKCGNCSITDTIWWKLACEKVPIEQLDGQQKQVIWRILHEPESIIPK